MLVLYYLPILSKVLLWKSMGLKFLPVITLALLTPPAYVLPTELTTPRLKNSQSGTKAA